VTSLLQPRGRRVLDLILPSLTKRIRRITHALRPEVLVELGVDTGNSYAAFCQAVKLIRIPAACFGVDTWQGDGHSGLYGGEAYNELLAWHDPRYGNFSPGCINIASGVLEPDVIRATAKLTVFVHPDWGYGFRLFLRRRTSGWSPLVKSIPACSRAPRSFLPGILAAP
jgi:hypothetical protein